MTIDSETLLPISNIIDISRLEGLDVKSGEFKVFITSLAEIVNKLLLSINNKSIGTYDTNETLSGKSYTTGDEQRPVSGFTKLIEFGALPNTATKQVAHNLDSSWGYSFKVIYGATSDPVNKKYLPLPYASATAADIIEVKLDNTYVYITTGKDMTAFTDTSIFIEYVE
jgi:hypothetical protein